MRGLQAYQHMHVVFNASNDGRSALTSHYSTEKRMQSVHPIFLDFRLSHLGTEHNMIVKNRVGLAIAWSGLKHPSGCSFVH